MNRKDEFETLLASLADAPVSSAGSQSSSRNARGKSPRRIKADLTELTDEISDEDVQREIQRAKKRLKRNPSLFSGDPDGFFTYEEPVLAIMAYLYQSHLLLSSTVGVAGEEGAELRNDSYWKWARTGVHMWRTRHTKSYQTLMGMTPRESIKIDKDVIRIAVSGDAGFRGQAQSNVIDMIREQHRANPFDLLIHLGDIYFAGLGDEFYKHLLAPFMKIGPPVLTLVGNHDLYFGADAFLNVLDILGQPGRYFSVENQHWRIACLDTALPAETLRRNSGLLDKGQLNWLSEQFEADDDKEMILMSHHYIVSAWEEASDGLKRQLASRINKIFSWYWGHEHGCAVYDKKAAGFYGACVGNGAFLEVWRPPSRKPLPKWYAEDRCSCYQAQSKFWPHGYLELELQPTKVVEKYHLEGGTIYTRNIKKTSRRSLVPSA